MSLRLLWTAPSFLGLPESHASRSSNPTRLIHLWNRYTRKASCASMRDLSQSVTCTNGPQKTVCSKLSVSGPPQLYRESVPSVLRAIQILTSRSTTVGWGLSGGRCTTGSLTYRRGGLSLGTGVTCVRSCAGFGLSDISPVLSEIPVIYVVR